LWAKSTKKPLKIRHWWLKDNERKLDFRFVERTFLAPINLTGSACASPSPHHTLDQERTARFTPGLFAKVQAFLYAMNVMLGFL